MHNVILIVCGSAASWMIDKIVNAKGGLHNRLTQKILLEPFKLKDTKEYLISRHIKLSNKQILDIYMVTGGIAYYLKSIKKGQSATQAINNICFDQNGLLFDEFEKLFDSLFDSAELNKTIIKAIATKRSGISRNELIAAGFLQRFTPYGKKRKDHYYRVIDEYTLFYLKWIEPFVLNTRSLPQKGYWQTITQTPQYFNWAGYAFEEICYKHINEIASALNLENTIWHASSWRQITKQGGAQIDLLFDRGDDVITICEIKYNHSKFVIDKSYAKNLMNKVDIFEKHSKTSKDIQIALITVTGLKSNLWSQELVQTEITVEDFFKD